MKPHAGYLFEMKLLKTCLLLCIAALLLPGRVLAQDMVWDFSVYFSNPGGGYDTVSGQLVSSSASPLNSDGFGVINTLQNVKFDGTAVLQSSLVAGYSTYGTTNNGSRPGYGGSGYAMFNGNAGGSLHHISSINFYFQNPYNAGQTFQVYTCNLAGSGPGCNAQPTNPTTSSHYYDLRGAYLVSAHSSEGNTVSYNGVVYVATGPGAAPEIDGKLFPQVGLLLACLFFMGAGGLRMRPSHGMRPDLQVSTVLITRA